MKYVFIIIELHEWNLLKLNSSWLVDTGAVLNLFKTDWGESI